MDVDVVGRVNNIRLPENQGMIAVYEAVINSLQTLDQVDPVERSITITIIRDHSQESLVEEEGPYFLPIKDVQVKDNGIGFTDENYTSFQTSDTTLKRAVGGKGIGRFLWLKAFEKVYVDSTYHDKGKMYNRKFDFVLTKSGIQNHSIQPLVLHRI